MRSWWLALVSVLLAGPWAGCLSGPAPDGLAALRSTLFSYDPVEGVDPVPEPALSCEGLHATLSGRMLDQARVQLERNLEAATRDEPWQVPWLLRRDVAVADDSVAVPAMDSEASGAPAPSAGKTSSEGAQATGTNNQEAAADEGDLVKTDGRWTYVVQGRYLYVIESPNLGDAIERARIDLGEHWGGELLLERRAPADTTDDRLVLVLPGYGQPARGGDLSSGRGLAMKSMPAMDSNVRVMVLSLADRTAPAVLMEAWLEGEAMGARLVDGTAYVIAHRREPYVPLETWPQVDEEILRARNLTWQDYEELPRDGREELLREAALRADARNRHAIAAVELADQLPTVLLARNGRTAPDPTTEARCGNVLVTPEGTGRGVSTILAIDLGVGAPASVTEMVGGRPVVYASGAALVLASPTQDEWFSWVQPNLLEATDLQWFSLDGLEVGFLAAGRVPGSILDSFALDVEGDQLRVATTTGTWSRGWVDGGEPQPMVSHVATFTAKAGLLVPEGIVGGIAPGERIWSVRFTPDRAYLVTFRNMDPLWVVDLKGEPEILGELEIPGVSTYIHPLSDDLLLAIGHGPGPGGEGLDWGKVEVSLFDVSDPTEPRRADRLQLQPPGGSGWSSALDEHRAFTYWSELGTLAVPLSYDAPAGDARDDPYGARQYRAGLTLVAVDEEAMRLTLRGRVDQDALANGWRGDVQRSWFLGFPERGEASVYALSAGGVTAHDLATLEPQGASAFAEGDGMYADPGIMVE